MLSPSLQRPYAHVLPVSQALDQPADGFQRPRAHVLPDIKIKLSFNLLRLQRPYARVLPGHFFLGPVAYGPDGSYDIRD